MNFRRGMARDEPEINLIPFIDVLLVILIFLMITTTYSRFTELQIQLPTADAEHAQQDRGAAPRARRGRVHVPEDRLDVERRRDHGGRRLGDASLTMGAPLRFAELCPQTPPVFAE